jgi:endonuclease/exonuclease/phosphatase family metal-dependent hydrolase
MKKLLFFVLILTVPFYKSVGQQTPVSKSSIKIMSYNLRFGELASLEKLAAYIKEKDPDMVALQEVDVKTFRKKVPQQNGKDFITELGYRTGMLTAYARTIDHARGYYGIGILSKYPISRTEKVLLPMPDGAKEQRALLIAEVELPGGNQLTFACTHLDHSTSTVRQTQVKTINSKLRHNAYPLIIAGDFNAKPNTPEIQKGMSSWKQATLDDFTSPAENPQFKIDYIFCRPANQWKVLHAETPKIQFSDHLPVLTELELIKQ